MLPLSCLLLLFPIAFYVVAESAGQLQSFSYPGGSAGFDPPDPCLTVFPPCLSEADRYSLEALRSIHQMMDDDQDGGIEVEESMEFIIEDMKQQQQTHKHSNLHREDQHITVEELWRGWKSSEVHNWTQEEVLRWLKEFVELPQYERNFKDVKVNGNTLPRIAANEPAFLSGHLKVQDQRDKQKIAIKALDVVLFGPPTRPPHNYMKDLVLIVSVVMGVGGCWFAQAQSKASKVHISKMMKDLESLQRAEQSLLDLQEQLERAQEEKRSAAEEKQNLEEKMRDEIMGAQEEAHRLHELRRGAVSELSRLRYAEEELEQVRGALKQAEQDMLVSWTVSEALQQWLQLTHEVELQYYNIKKQSAEQQLTVAREEAERIKKKRSTVLGTLHVAHSSSLDQVDHKILEAKNALSEVTACLRERLHRWQQIELLCGFPVIRNPGLAQLTTQLYSDSIAVSLPRVLQAACSCHGSIHGSIENLLDEAGPPIMQQIPVQVSSIKCSPRTHRSTVCRSRRPGMIAQSASALISPDPDLLIPIRPPYPRHDESEDIFIKTLKKQDSQEKFFDTDSHPSAPLTKMFPCSAIDPPLRKFYQDEAELLADITVLKSKKEEREPTVECPGHSKVFQEEPEVFVDAEASGRRVVKERIHDPSLKSFVDDGTVNIPSRFAFQDKTEGSPDVEYYPKKAEREAAGDLMVIHSRHTHNDRKKHRAEVEAPTEAPRMLSRGMMGSSMDSLSKKMLSEHLIEPRRFTRDSMGMSQDLGSWKLARSKAELAVDAPVRGISLDKLSENAIQTSVSVDEQQFVDSALVKMASRDTLEGLVETASSGVVSEPDSEATAMRRMLTTELDRSVESLRRKIQGVPREENNIAVGWEQTDGAKERPKHLHWREESGGFESSSLPSRTGQPDLMLTSQVPWRSSTDLYAAGPLSQLVYDGILEKSCSAPPPNPMTVSASTPNLHQTTRMPGEVEPPMLRLAFPSTESPPEEERSREKEKSKKSMKLKNLFKKKNEPSAEKTQSGLQKL